MELLSGGGQEPCLLWGRRCEPGQLTVGGKVTGAGDDRSWYLNVHAAQECPIASGRPALTRRLSSRQTDECGGQARSFQTPYEVVNDGGLVDLQMMALIKDDGDDSHDDECIQACPGAGAWDRVDGAAVELIDLMADSGST